MTSLHVSPDYSPPLKLLELRTIIWGGSEAGKTTCARVLYEEAVKAGVVTGAIDLKGDFWGLMSTADGKGEGIPVVVFGGEHARVRITPDSGALIAQEIVDLRMPWVLDLEEFTKGQQIRFLANFLPVLYDKNRESMVVFFDEADRYAPQGRVEGEGASALGATEDIAKRGRKHGLFPVFITQRNQALNKQVAELCDAAFVFRTPGPRAQEAALEWFGSKSTAAEMKEVAEGIAVLDTGEAFLCSSSPKVRVFKRIHVRAPWTYDSSATPEIGKERRHGPKVLAEADVKAIEQRIAATVQKVKENDPTELKKTITTLRRELSERAFENHRRPVEQVERVVEKVVEKPILKDEQIARLERALVRADDIAEKFLTHRESIFTAATEIRSGLDAVRVVRTGAPTTVPSSVHRPSGQEAVAAPRRHAVVGGPVRAESNGDLPGPQQRILNVMATLGALGYEQPSRPQIGVWLRVKATTGSFKNYLGALRTAGLITYVGSGDKGRLQLTEAGAAQAVPEEIPSAQELQRRVLSIFPNRTIQTVLQTLIDNYPAAVRRSDLGATANVDHTTGSFKNYLGALRSAGLIEYVTPGDEGTVIAQSVLFLEAA